MNAVIYTGILLALVATTAYNVGLILEKRALGQMPALDIRRVLRVIVSLLASRAWLAGFALMLTGLACQTIALTFEPVSVVQPVLASGVVLVLVLSRLVLRERLHGGETWCVAAIAVSVSLLLHDLLLARGVRRDGTRFPVLRLSWRFASAAALMGAAVFLLNSAVALWVVVPVAVCVYLVLVVVLRAFSSHEIAAFKTHLQSALPRLGRAG